MRLRQKVKHPVGGHRWQQKKGTEGPFARWLQRPCGQAFFSKPNYVLLLPFIFCTTPLTLFLFFGFLYGPPYFLLSLSYFSCKIRLLIPEAGGVITPALHSNSAVWFNKNCCLRAALPRFGLVHSCRCLPQRGGMRDQTLGALLLFAGVGFTSHPDCRQVRTPV